MTRTLVHGHATRHRDRLADHIARLLRGEEDERRGEFYRLPRTADRRLRTELLDLLVRDERRLEGRPDGSGGHAVDTDAALDELLRHRPCPVRDAGLRHGVLGEGW